MLGSFKKELLILVVSIQIFQHLNLDSIWLQRSSTNYMAVEIPLTSSNHSDPTCLKRQPSNICNMQLFWSDGNQSDGDRPARKDILCAMRAITVASITIKQDQTISKKQGWSSWSHRENILWRPKNHSGNLVWSRCQNDVLMSNWKIICLSRHGSSITGTAQGACTKISKWPFET